MKYITILKVMTLEYLTIEFGRDNSPNQPTNLTEITSKTII